MLIECTIRRKAGSSVTMGDKIYKFAPNAAGAHVCEVSIKEHQDCILAVQSSFVVYRDVRSPKPVPVITNPVPEKAPESDPLIVEAKAFDPDKASDDEVVAFAKSTLRIEDPADKEELAEYADEVLGFTVEKKKKSENITRDIIRAHLAKGAA